MLKHGSSGYIRGHATFNQTGFERHSRYLHSQRHGRLPESSAAQNCVAKTLQ